MSFKKINKNGSVTIPKDIRAEVGLFTGKGVEINANSDGSVTIKSSAPCCRFCGSPEKVIVADDIKICMRCAKKFLAKVDMTND